MEVGAKEGRIAAFEEIGYSAGRAGKAPPQSAIDKIANPEEEAALTRGWDRGISEYLAEHTPPTA